MQYIYSRVSTEKQETENQAFHLKARFPEAEVIEETISGKCIEKPALDALLARLVKGDVLVIAALDRLGRNAGKAIQVMDSLYSRGIIVISVRENLDYSTASGKFQGQIMLAMSELERDITVLRTKAALARLKAEGVQLGRPRKYDDSAVKTVLELRAQGKTIKQINQLTNISTGRIHALVKRG